MARKYKNILLSNNPCPTCLRISGVSRTLAEWEASPEGLPQSSGRICEIHCHCILVPDDKLDTLPAIGEQVKLRGDKDTDVFAVVEIHPSEEAFKVLVTRYKKEVGALPLIVYSMPLNQAEEFLKEGLE